MTDNDKLRPSRLNAVLQRETIDALTPAGPMATGCRDVLVLRDGVHVAKIGGITDAVWNEWCRIGKPEILAHVSPRLDAPPVQAPSEDEIAAIEHALRWAGHADDCREHRDGPETCDCGSSRAVEKAREAVTLMRRARAAPVTAPAQSNMGEPHVEATVSKAACDPALTTAMPAVPHGATPCSPAIHAAPSAPAPVTDDELDAAIGAVYQGGKLEGVLFATRSDMDGARVLTAKAKEALRALFASRVAPSCDVDRLVRAIETVRAAENHAVADVPYIRRCWTEVGDALSAFRAAKETP